jgi:tRNA 2-thiouridine synthesizing protein A
MGRSACPSGLAGCEGKNSMAEEVLDLTGLKCPLPAMATKKALRTLAPGCRIVVITTDPLAGIDIPNAVREEGARLEDQSRFEGGVRFLISRPVSQSADAP